MEMEPASDTIVEMSGVQFVTTVLSYHATLLFELPLPKLVAFVASVNISGMSRNDRHCLGYVLTNSSMEEIEQLLEDTYGIKQFEERGHDEAEEDDEWEPSSDEFSA